MIERDPNGLDQHVKGAKLDAGKLRPGLVLGGFSRAITEVVKIGTEGANKYTDHGWKHVSNGVNRYTEAMLRHLLSEMNGEEIDPGFGLKHAAHLAWNALARLELMIEEEECGPTSAYVNQG